MNLPQQRRYESRNYEDIRSHLFVVERPVVGRYSAGRQQRCNRLDHDRLYNHRQERGKGSGGSGVWFAYTSLAVYDAVNAITGQYRPFYYRGTGSQTASVDAAAAAAAHRILLNYFPAQQSDLDAKFAASLSNISADPAAKDAGVAVGEAAAAALIAARTGDGLEANVPYVPGTGPGAWIPTPPAFLPRGNPVAGPDAPIHDEYGGRFPAGRTDASGK